MKYAFPAFRWVEMTASSSNPENRDDEICPTIMAITACGNASTFAPDLHCSAVEYLRYSLIARRYSNGMEELIGIGDRAFIWGDMRIQESREQAPVNLD